MKNPHPYLPYFQSFTDLAYLARLFGPLLHPKLSFWLPRGPRLPFWFVRHPLLPVIFLHSFKLSFCFALKFHINFVEFIKNLLNRKKFRQTVCSCHLCSALGQVLDYRVCIANTTKFRKRKNAIDILQLET